MQIKFNYTNGNEFILPTFFYKTNQVDISGNAIVSDIYGKKYSVDSTNHYIGYYNVDDNNDVYTEKYYNEKSEQLTHEVEYSSGFNSSEYFKDRILYNELTLPYSIDEILIEPNEIVTFNILNQKIQYLQKNLMYMYGQMFVGSTNVPVDKNVNTLCNKLGTTDFKWERREESSIAYNKLSRTVEYNIYGEYDNIKSFVVIPFRDKTGISIIAISNTHVMGLTSLISEDGQLSNANFLLYSNVIDNNTEQECINLEDICFDGRYLFISDSKVNGGGQVFKYDVTTFYTNDRIFEGKKFLVEPIGGYGDIDKRNKFNGCSILGITPNQLWIYDSGNNAIKVFDNNFIFKKLIKVPTGSYKVLDIRYRKLNDRIYVLYENSYDPNNLKFGYFEYTSNYRLMNTCVFEDVLYDENDKRFNRMCISEQDSNVFYALTNNSIYKKFFTKPEKTFAIFDRKYIFPDDNFIWDINDENWDLEEKTWNNMEFYTMFKINDVFVVDSDKNKDDLYIIGSSYITHFNEKTEYNTVLRNINLPYYNMDKIKFENIEYNQALVLNKEFYKLFSNIVSIKNSLKGRFFAEYNDFGDIIYNDPIYLSDDEINTLNVELELNSFINDNELVQPNVLNRLITNIYNYQLKLLELTKARLRNIKTWVDLRQDLADKTNIFPIE
jgi:hypothetical protein